MPPKEIKSDRNKISNTKAHKGKDIYHFNSYNKATRDTTTTAYVMLIQLYCIENYLTT